MEQVALKGWVERGSYGYRHGLCWAVWVRDERGLARIVDTADTKKSALRLLAAHGVVDGVALSVSGAVCGHAS